MDDALTWTNYLWGLDRQERLKALQLAISRITQWAIATSDVRDLLEAMNRRRWALSQLKAL